MPRKQKKYHYIYKTTCQVTGKFYVGMHSTDNLEDGYLGSGKILGYSRAKHGDENHIKEILEYLPNREALALREKEIIDDTLLADPLNINLRYGGEGGGFLAEKNKTNGFHAAGGRATLRVLGKRHQEKLKNDLEYRKRFSEAISASWKRQPIGNTRNLGSHRSDETRKQMSISGTGEKNSQFGTCWMNKDVQIIKIKKEQVDEYLVLGFSLGKVQRLEKPKKVYAHVDEYLRLKPLCRNSECLTAISFIQFKNDITSCSKSCSNKTRLLK